MNLIYSAVLVLFLASLVQVEANNPVIGYIDAVRDGKVYGWACQKLVPTSIDVHMYAGNSAGGPGAVFVASVKANVHAEVAVANACGSNFLAHRYVIHLNSQQRERFRNMKVYVHGIKLFGNGPNSLLVNSGRFRIDPTPVPVVDPCTTRNRQLGPCNL